jgi:hypothetical protein
VSYFIIGSQSKCVLSLFLCEKDCQFPVSEFGALRCQILGQKQITTVCTSKLSFLAIAIAVKQSKQNQASKTGVLSKATGFSRGLVF